MIIDRAFSVVSVTRNLFNQFAIRLENSRIGIGKMSALGMISQCHARHQMCGWFRSLGVGTKRNNRPLPRRTAA
jgi:hypothetical protein